MERHGLEGHRIAQFREAVYAACAGHLYPELLEGEHLAYRPDVAAFAEALYASCSTVLPNVPLPTLLGFVEELKAAVMRGEGPRPSRAQKRKQAAALAFAQAATAMYHAGSRGRMAWWAGDLFETNAGFTGAHFGPAGLGGRLSVLGQRAMAAFYQGHSGPSVHRARRLLELSDMAEARGEAAIAADAHLKAVHCLSELEPGSPTHLIESAVARLHRATSVERRDGNYAPHFDLVWACLAAQRANETERWLTEFEQWWAPSHEKHPQWHQARGWLALARGDVAEARRCFGEESRFRLACDQAEDSRRPLSYAEYCRERQMALARGEPQGNR